MRSKMSFQAKRELLAHVAPRYQQASHTHKSVILDEFVAATGYARKYAIRLLTRPPLTSVASIRRPRRPHYGADVQAALVIAWHATNQIGAKRLVPFLAELVPLLERHGHLTLTKTIREQLLAISPATADRLLHRVRAAAQTRGISTTHAGTLLKRSIPVRTFADWDDVKVGFVEADLVAHCGGRADGAFLSTFVLTDIATGWVECQALLYRSQDQVLQALRRARQLLPFALTGLDTDNGGEFINHNLIAYCEHEHITFTRGRAYRKNDQCYVEQKNGAVVRQFVGYDRYEGEHAYYQLVELYRALRLYINFFQPSVKLKEKHSQEGKTRRTYDVAQTPFQRLLAARTLVATEQERLTTIFAALDPVRLLEQIGQLQAALCQHAVVGTTPTPNGADVLTRFRVDSCITPSLPEHTPQHEAQHAPAMQKRTYRRTTSNTPRWWRTRVDPFADVWTQIQHWLEAQPERTAKSVFEELQRQHPEQYPDVQLRTLQRRIAKWRATVITTFDDGWMHDEVLRAGSLPRPLGAVDRSSPQQEGR